MSDLKTYVLVNKKGESEGRFTGRTPGQAATKAFTSVCRNSNKKTAKNVPISIRQTGTEKVYNYSGSRTKLRQPVEVEVGDSTITYNYKNKVKRNF